MIRHAILWAVGPDRAECRYQAFDPWTPVAGIPLARRCLLSLEQQGVQSVFIIGGGPGGDPRRAEESLAPSSDSALTVRWLEDAAEPRRQARQLLESGAFALGPALLLPLTLLHGPELLSPLLDLDDGRDDAVLLLDGAVGRVFDPSRALKVCAEGDRVVRIGPDLTQYDALMAEVAIVTERLVERIARGQAESFVATLRQAAAAGRLRGEASSGAQWQVVDSPETLSHAEWLVRAYGEELAGDGAPRQVGTVGATSAERTLGYIEGLLSEKRARHFVLLNPGPVLTSPRVKSALVHQDVCHRDADFALALRRVQRKLRRVCRGGSEHEVMILGGSGTAAMEAALLSFVPREGKLLIVSNGAFGERFAEIAAVHDLAVRHLKGAWGAEVDPAAVARALDEDAGITGVIMCHHETSVGLLNPVAEVGRLCRQRDRVFFVDAVSSLGGEDLDVRRDKIDVLISSPNKCLHAVSGCSFVCVHERVWKRVEELPARSYYLDLRRYRAGQIPFTPAVSNIFALSAALDELLRDGASGRVRHYRALNRKMRLALRRLGLEPLTDTGHESHTVCTVRVPEGMTFAELYAALKAEGYIVYQCKAHLEERYFQVANMGELSEEMVRGFLEALERVLHKAGAGKPARLYALQTA
ncbi:MAG: alanine--glyoxylate aminotransferase family protein [Deltaproteobacteria bacterium]|nr:alanine--glyoxylate aminotransferase family protein [Deltaproteobacteria bacterium]